MSTVSWRYKLRLATGLPCGRSRAPAARWARSGLVDRNPRVHRAARAVASGDMAPINVTAGGILSTDEYQLTMAQLYFRSGLHERRARFEHFFREYPDYGEHQAGYCVAAGLHPLVEWLCS